MHITTPSEALEKLKGFNSRIDRLESNSYSDKKFRTQDLNKLKWELPRIRLLASIGVHNKNKQRANTIIAETRSKLSRAIEIKNS
ncbi:MAG: hypothetical protein ACI9AT_000423 [Ulvibacter sp.]|jgi:hypothetical protein